MLEGIFAGYAIALAITLVIFILWVVFRCRQMKKTRQNEIFIDQDNWGEG